MHSLSGMKRIFIFHYLLYILPTLLTLRITPKMRMPSFSPEENAELEKIMQSANQRRPIVSSPKSSNLDNPKQHNKDLGSEQLYKQISPPEAIYKPNKDWRNALSNPYRPAKRLASEGAKPSGSKIKPTVSPSFASSTIDIEFDYDDFEQAMLEEDMGYIQSDGKGSVEDDVPEEHDGLYSGMLVDSSIWKTLVDIEGEDSYSFSRIHKEVSDIVVFYADPRTSSVTGDLKTIMKEFEQVPRSKLKVALVAVTSSPVPEVRKFVKKLPTKLSVPLLIDAEHRFMETLRCRGQGRMMSALGFVQVKTGSLLKIWYQGDWDPVTTKDLVIEEINEYRRSPSSFMNSQVGIR